MGIPFQVSRSLEPGELREARLPDFLGGDRVAVFAHPTVVYALQIAHGFYDGLDSYLDPAVQIAASLTWQREEIERNAEWAERHLDIVMQQQDQRRAIRADAERIAALLSSAAALFHEGEPHHWRLDHLRQLLICTGCKHVVTTEMAVRLGIDIPKGPQLQVLVDGEWQDVKGIGEASIQFEVDTSAFERGLGAR